MWQKVQVGGIVGGVAGPAAKTTLRASFVPVEVSSVKIPPSSTSFGVYVTKLTVDFSTMLSILYLHATSLQYSLKNGVEGRKKSLRSRSSK